jgi:hypothetical protein
MEITVLLHNIALGFFRDQWLSRNRASITSANVDENIFYVDESRHAESGGKTAENARLMWYTHVI